MTQRSLSQNSAAHLYFTQLAKAMNDSGYDVRKTIKMPVDFTPDTVKEYLFKPVMMALYPDKASTTELSTTELSEVYENLNRLTSDKFGIGLEFPSYENELNESRVRE